MCNVRDCNMTRVVVGEDIPQGASSYDLPVDTFHKYAPGTSIVILKRNHEGVLVCGEDELLVQSLKWSDDIHSCNVILERGNGEKTVKLRATRNARKGEEVTMWFSQELLAAMDIPFLNPINILGEKTYTCHRCGQIFEYPNPLKLHLGLNCGVLKKKELWKRLRSSLLINPRIPEFIFKLSLKKRKTNETSSFKPPSPVLSSYSSPSPERVDFAEDTRPSSEPPRHSAFKPYLNKSPEPREILSEKESEERMGHFSHLVAKEHYLNQQAAEIETLVSNLGQSKQGHLCLYCGKIYSRKYGLKIHIRTHTGFKPLKCKYCLRPFGDPSNLNKHVRLHAETDTPYRCRLCGKMLVRRRDLERHMKSRHEIHDFQ